MAMPVQPDLKRPAVAAPPKPPADKKLKPHPAQQTVVAPPPDPAPQPPAAAPPPTPAAAPAPVRPQPSTLRARHHPSLRIQWHHAAVAQVVYQLSVTPPRQPFCRGGRTGGRADGAQTL